MTTLHLGIFVETPATGYAEAEIGIAARVPTDGGCAELEAVEEVSLDGGPWLTFEELQARGFRTLAHELALAAEREVEGGDVQDALFREAEEDARGYAEEWAELD